MAKKQTTQKNVGVRGQADQTIVAAAGQAYKPVNIDISGYMKALGNVATTLVERQNKALEMEEGVDLTDEIKNDPRFGEELQSKRKAALDNIRTMKNTLAFTPKHKKAKKEYEANKKYIENLPKFFESTDKLSEGLDQVVYVDPGDESIKFVNISPIENEAKTNYLLAMHNKEWQKNKGYDVDGDNIPDFDWIQKDKDGNFKVFSGEFKKDANGNPDPNEPIYKSPKDINISFVKKDAGKDMYGKILTFVGKTGLSTTTSGYDETQFANAANNLKLEILNMKKTNPGGYENMLVTNDFELADGTTTNFVKYYMKNQMYYTDETMVSQENLDEIEELFETYENNPEQAQAMQTLYNAIKQYDPTFQNDMDTFLEAVINKNKDLTVTP
tara:strand:- start:205 stop:1362 length:1158 start_codon:yes stop_codon:yes gene_type:complete